MSLIKARKIATLDAEAKDIKLPFIITFNNGKKEFREGYSEEEVRRRFDKSVAALYGGIKSVKLEDEDKRDGKDSAAADAKFKIGDRVRLAGTASPALGKTGVVVKVDGEWGDVTVKTDEGKTYQYEASAVQKVADSCAADACGTDAEFQKGDKVRVWQYPVYGKMGEVVEATNGSMEYTVNVEGKDYPRIDYRRIVKVSNTAGDAAAADAEFKVGDKVKLSGSHPRFPNKVGVVTHVFPTGFVKVKVDGIEDIEIAERLISKAEDAAEKGSRELQNVFYGALYALKKVADRAKVEGAQTLVDAANSAAKELTSKSYTVF